VLGTYWWAGGGGFPFAPIDRVHASGSVLEGSRAEIVAPFMAVLGLAGAVIAVLMARSTRATGLTRARMGLLLFGWTMAATLTLVVPDYFLLAFVAFAPLFVIFAFTGVPGDQDGLGDILYWHRTNLVIMFVGGLLWAGATLAYQRRSRGACVACGRLDGADGGGPSPERLRRWGRWAVVVACLAPLPYEATRIAWYFGHPMGITRDFLTMMKDTPGMLEVGLGAAVASIAGGVLTHGLVHRWGEVYPRWVWFKAGRPVPPALAVVPASIVAIVLIPAGVMNVRMEVTRESWGINGPGILWIVWGLALGVAALVYYLRRRPACRRCGSGTAAARGAALTEPSRATLVGQQQASR
jgi:hypothetical protein